MLKVVDKNGTDDTTVKETVMGKLVVLMFEGYSSAVFSHPNDCETLLTKFREVHSSSEETKEIFLLEGKDIDIYYDEMNDIEEQVVLKSDVVIMLNKLVGVKVMEREDAPYFDK